MSFRNRLALRLYKWIEKKEHTLLYLFLEITRKCNLACLHCGSDCKKTINFSELTTASWEKIIEYFAEHFSKELVFVITGGEPLLHPDLDRIGAFIKGRERNWGMVTNGFLLTEKRLAQLQKSGLKSLTISLDGIESSHNWLRNNGDAYTKAIKAITAIGNAGIDMSDVVTCVYPGNLHELDRIAEILLFHKIPAWRLFRIFPSGRATGNPDLLLNFSQTWELINWISQVRKLYLRMGLKIDYSCEGYLPLSIDRKIRAAPFFCRAGINIAAILSDGSITGCSNNHTTFYEGNIMTDNFAYLWEHGFIKFRQKSWLKETICSNCHALKECNGSSIHLWQSGQKYPAFCYLKDTNNIT